MLEELQRVPPNVRFNLIVIGRIATATRRSQSVLIEHPQPRQSMNTQNSKKGLSTFILDDTTDAPSTGSILRTKEGSECHLDLLNTVKVDLKLKEVLILNYDTTADDLHLSLQQ